MNLKKLKSLGIFGLLGLAVIAFSLSALLARPSDATSDRYQRLIAMGVVDAVVTPQELGLDYLQQEQFQLSADPELINAIYKAEEAVSIMPKDIPLEFPYGTNSPIAVGRIPHDTGTPSEARDVVAEGFVNENGQPRAFNASILEGMFELEADNGGNLVMTPEAQEILVADASGGFLQAKRIPVMDLIVRNPSNGRRYVVRRVHFNAVCRDALNAVFNQTLRRNETWNYPN